MRLSDFDFDLPAERIAQAPADRRDDSRLLVIDRGRQTFNHSCFRCLPELLKPGDLLVLNRSRVLPARLVGRRPGGGAAEILLIKKDAPNEWQALLKPARRLRPGTRVEIAEDFVATIQAGPTQDEGWRRVRLDPGSLTDDQAIERYGHVPLPPYIERAAQPEDTDRYQTVYAREPGSIAAPTAGLHFTPELLSAIRDAGVGVAEIVLHVGPGTFQPIRDPAVAGHRLAPEPAFIPKETADLVTSTRERGGRIIAVGTTVTRTLESAASAGPAAPIPGQLEADIFITPGYSFRIVSGLITNFHLPRSSLLVLVSAFAGRQRILAAYAEAIARGYRFYSYGDACLIF